MLYQNFTIRTINFKLLRKRILLNGFLSLTANVWWLCDGGEIEAEKLNLLLMFNQGTNVCFSTKAPLLQNRCYVPLNFKAQCSIT